MEKNGMVEISAMTLNALKNMLFSGEGVNIDPIVEDIVSGSGFNKDLTAINCALLMKGYKPEVDTTTRFRRGCTYNDGYSQHYIRIEFKSYSLIANNVTVIETEVHYDNGEWKDGKLCKEKILDYNEWLKYKVSESDYVDEIIEAENHNKK